MKTPSVLTLVICVLSLASSNAVFGKDKDKDKDKHRDRDREKSRNVSVSVSTGSRAGYYRGYGGPHYRHYGASPYYHSPYARPYYGYSPYSYGPSPFAPSPGIVVYRSYQPPPQVVYRGYAVDSGPGSVTVDVQRELRRRGYYHSSIDGNAGPGTRQAIRTYQIENRLPVTGRIDRSLLRSLDLQ
jgi:hypothetical protein